MAVPERIGEIELVRELGRGGMGVVWLGRDALLGRQVAVKFLPHADASPDDPGFSAFVEGARLAASLRSRRLIEIYRAGVHEKQAYLVMEYSPGTPLSELIARNDRWTRPAAIATMGEVCSAIAELHEQGIVHGDIKPSNILIEPDGRVVVTDFGLTLSLPREQVGAARALGGTPRYMAPEVFSGKATYQSDVYALGIMFFETLCGRPPFDGDASELRRLHAFAVLPWQRIHPPVDTALREIIERATHREARLRSKSARHMLDAMKRAVPDENTWNCGRADLVVAASEHSRANAPAATPASRGSSYYEAIGSLARVRGAPQAPVETLQPLPGRTEGVVERLLPCANCQYDLCGTPLSGVCPECGLPVEVSTDRSRMVFADSRWLRRVRRGLLAVMVVPGAMLAVPGLSIYLAAVLYGDSPGARSIAASIVLMSLLFIVAVWQATPPESLASPGRGEIVSDTRARRCVRALSLLVFIPLSVQYLSSSAKPWFWLAIMLSAVSVLAISLFWLLWVEHLLVRGWSRPLRRQNCQSADELAATKRKMLRRKVLLWTLVACAPGWLDCLRVMIMDSSGRVIDVALLIGLWTTLGCMLGTLACGWGAASSARKEIRTALLVKAARSAGRSEQASTSA